MYKCMIREKIAQLNGQKITKLHWFKRCCEEDNECRMNKKTTTINCFRRVLQDTTIKSAKKDKCSEAKNKKAKKSNINQNSNKY
jgi:hypothetical protein